MTHLDRVALTYEDGRVLITGVPPTLTGDELAELHRRVSQMAREERIGRAIADYVEGTK